MPFPAIPDDPKGPGKNGPNNRSPWSGPRPPATNPGDAKINPRPYIPSPTGSGTYVPKYPNLGEMPPNSQWINRTYNPTPPINNPPGGGLNPPGGGLNPPGGGLNPPGGGLKPPGGGLNPPGGPRGPGIGGALGALSFVQFLLTPPGPLSDGTLPGDIRQQRERERPRPPIVDLTPPSTPQAPVYPFNGGQESGILYRVTIDSNGNFPGGVFTTDLVGPIGGIRFFGRGNNFPVGISHGNNDFFQFGWSQSYAPAYMANPDPIIIRIVRVDGQPDNTNPPPIVPGVNYGPVTNITNNQTINNGPTIINNFPAAPTGFPAAAPPPAARPTGTGTGAGADPGGKPDPNDDRTLVPDKPPIQFIPVPFGVPVGSGPDGGPLIRNTRVNDPVIDAAKNVNPNAFKPIISNGDGTVTTGGTINPPTATPPNLQPPNTITPPINDTTKKDSEKTTQIPPLFTPIPAIDPTKDKPFEKDPEPPKVEQTPAGNSCCVPTPIANQLSQLQNRVNPTDLIDWSILGIINNKLGAQVNGGLSGFLKRIDASRMVDRALNIMGTAASIHNAAMLSRDIAGTLGQTVANLLAVVGIKDADDRVSTFTEAISRSIQNTIKDAVGESNYTALSEAWASANRIYQSAINIFQMMTDSLSGLAEGLELTAKYSGKIGNALRKSGAVLENSYNWMSETFNFRTGKLGAIDRVIRGLDQAQEVASDLESATGEFRNVAENVTAIGNELNTIRTEIQGKETQKQTTETAGKNNSQSPNINQSDLNKPEG